MLGLGLVAGTNLTYRVFTSRTGSGAGARGTVFRVGYSFAYALFVAANLMMMWRHPPHWLSLLIALCLAPFPLM